MEKRIRIVWVLSLLSVLLLIVLQGYWLFNQYTYVVDTYAEELAHEVLQNTHREYEIRKAHVKMPYTFMVNTNSEYTGGDSSDVYSRDQMKFSLLKQDSANLSRLTLDSVRRYVEQQVSLPYDSFISNQNERISQTPDLADGLNLSINIKVSQTEMLDYINRAIVNYHHPFGKERLDSILTAEFPEQDFRITDWDANDTVYTFGWKQTGNMFHPGIRIAYAYSPFQKEGAYIYTKLPAQPVFGKMAVQLVLALGIILLLIGCLAFQIRTILKQKKIGELRQSFVNTMIHELKRPVQTLKTFVAFLGDKELRADEQATEEVVQDAMFELDNLSAYLNKLKDMVRADNESTPLNPVSFNLHELTEKVIRLTHIPVDKHVSFTVNFDMEFPYVEADPIHLANVLSNLIENAIKYSDTEVEIEIKASRKGKELWLTVSDNGIGIPLTEQDRVFAKFYRGTNLPDRNIPGLGLGLSYVKLISEAHQGYVSLESAMDRGTTITLYIPQ